MNACGAGMVVRIWMEILEWLTRRGRYTDAAAIQMTMNMAAEGMEIPVQELMYLERIAKEFREWKENGSEK